MTVYKSASTTSASDNNKYLGLTGSVTINCFWISPKILSGFANNIQLSAEDQGPKALQSKTSAGVCRIIYAHGQRFEFVLPDEKCGKIWQKVIDTSEGFVGEKDQQFQSGISVTVPDRSVLVFKSRLE